MTSSTSSSSLERRATVARLLRERGNALVVTGLGNPTYDVAAAGDVPGNFYLWGAMGGAAMTGLGIALAQPSRKVVVVTGDGEMLMGMGALATIGVKRPANLVVLVLDNEHYAETGMQPAHTGRGVDLTAVAQASGIKDARTVRTPAELESLASDWPQAKGLLYATIKVAIGPLPVCLPSRDGPYMRSRFREALLGSAAHT
jgi:thiamine pyrophosphate-dependent acetolactate synthase large subunit-like protein